MPWWRWKPLKGWRVFAGEIGVVTLGVLIALLAQQLAQEIDWRNRAAGARGALRKELVEYYRNAIEWRVTEPCIAAQLAAMDRRVLGSGDRLSPAPVFRDEYSQFAVRTPSRTYADGAWQGTIAEGVSSHLRPEERSDYVGAYSSAAALADLNRKLVATVERLDVLTKPDPLDPGVRLSLLQTIADARGANELIGVIAGQLILRVERMKQLRGQEGIASLPRSGTYRFCRAHRLPLRTIAQARAGVD